MKILDVQSFTTDQQKRLRERQVSNMVRFVDKTAQFGTFYPLNDTLSTAEYGTNTVDQYIGPNSPVRYDEIKNFPIFGIPSMRDETEYEDDSGFDVDSLSFEGYYPADVAKANVGSCMKFDAFNPDVLFMVDEVLTIEIKNKSFVKLKFSAATSGKLSQLPRQIVRHFTAMYENIGTESKVVIEDDILKQNFELRQIYKDVVGYYVDDFYDEYACTFLTRADVLPVPNQDRLFADKLLLHFMQEERVIVFDKLLKSSLAVDYNGIAPRDKRSYNRCMFYGLTHKNMKRCSANQNTGKLEIVSSPFAYAAGGKTEAIYVVDSHMDGKDEKGMIIKYDYMEIEKACTENMKSDNASGREELLSLIVKGFNGGIITPKELENVSFTSAEEIDQFYMVPMILYLVREQILQTESRNT